MYIFYIYIYTYIYISFIYLSFFIIQQFAWHDNKFVDTRALADAPLCSLRRRVPTTADALFGQDMATFSAGVGDENRLVGELHPCILTKTAN